MKNVFLFIVRYANLIFFLILQAGSLSMLFQYNKFHESVFSSVYNEFSGRINTRYNNVEIYFSLKNQNDELREQNAQLLNMLKADFAQADTSKILVSDSSGKDSTVNHRKFFYLPAKVISNSVSSQKNYLMLHRGSDQGVDLNMAVVGPSGVVGTVIDVSPNMCVVMSMLHRQTKIVAVLKKGSGFGEVWWDGKDPRYVSLTKIPKTVPIFKGDTVVTSQYSDKYPPGHVIGFVEAMADDQETGTYDLKIRTAVNFQELQHAYVVRNLQQDEMMKLKKSIQEGNND
jgi:rod shape-determining protein MreC